MGRQIFVNMAAAVGRLLSFSKNAKLFVSPLRLSASSVGHYSIETSNTGEIITHTGQVRFNYNSFNLSSSVMLLPSMFLGFFILTHHWGVQRECIWL